MMKEKSEKTLERYNPDYKTGLNYEQVNKRKQENLVNIDTTVKTKSIRSIIVSNFFTLFNIMNFILALLIFLVGAYKNLLFIIIVVLNTLISTIQEIYSKKTIDKLSFLAQTKTKVIREGKHEEVSNYELVLDDVIVLNAGNQIPTDSMILEGEVEVNESLLTGEPDNIEKQKGDKLLSGSFIVSGRCFAKVEHIGKENYVAKISQEAKQKRKINSEIMNSLNKIIKIISFVIIPVGILLFFNQLDLQGNDLKTAIVSTVAALIGMIPEGLVLLTSSVLAVSVTRLARKKVLVQELYCIETLARVDVLCLDKTGTITEGRMSVDKIISSNNNTEEQIKEILGILGKYSEDKNSTIEAIREKFTTDKELKVKSRMPFKSSNKWSGISFEDITYVLGAPEVVCNSSDEIEKYISEYRVVAIGKSKEKIDNKLPNDIEVLGYILISDVIRKNSKEILEYFDSQGVAIKLISGDNPITVSNIARKAGVKDYQNYIDARTLKTDEELKNAALKYTIFGRVTPEQKKQIILALKEQKHTVAMTGDGVNDVLALKNADCSISIANGSDAARNVSQLVLLDSDFKSMPNIVAEGRRTINNIQRSATLFLVKTIYATILAVLFVFINMPYPFIPIQLTLINLVVTGIPSVILALEPNRERIKGKFIINVIKRALPTALTVVTNIIIIGLISSFYNLDYINYSSVCVVVTAITGFILLCNISRPFNLNRGILFVGVILIFTVGITVFRDLFSIRLDASNTLPIAILGVTSIFVGVIYNLISNKIFKLIEKKMKIKKEDF